jgi:hypothetical protein
MDILRKTIAALCAILLIISGMIALLAFNIEWYAFDANVYKRAFERQNLYVRAPDILTSALQSYLLENPNTDPYLKELTYEDWRATITSIVPPEELKLLTDSALDSVFDYLNDRTNSATITLVPIKARLTGPAGVEIVQKILHAQPDCTADQLLQMGLGFLSGNIGLCNPPPELLGLVNPLIESQLQLLTFSIPNEVTLIASTPGDPANDPRARLRQVRTLMTITPVFPLFFLFCLTIFAVRSLIDWLQWWGYPFLITGGAGAIIALAGAPVLGIIVQSILEIYGSGFIPPILFSALREAVSVVTGEILRPILYEGLILAAVGFSMSLTTLLLTSRNNSRT